MADEFKDLIEKTGTRYRRERDRFAKLSVRVADICREEIVENNAIRAQVTFRTKSIKSFEGKLHRFKSKFDYSALTPDELFSKISDFSGVRIAAYRQEDEAKIVESITQRFTGVDGGEVEIDFKDKLDPSNASFYRSTHCQVKLKEDELIGDMSNLGDATCEIQVCSMMAHVWNEIEHDIGYKPDGGGPNEVEKGMLEALGHLVRSGDTIITRLLAANLERMKDQAGDFNDVHNFVAKMQPLFPSADLSVNAGQVFEWLKILGITSLEDLRAALGHDGLNLKSVKTRIEKFNSYLSSETKLALNPSSADLILIGLLEKFPHEILEMQDGKNGITLPPRVKIFAQHHSGYVPSPKAS